MKSLQDRQQTEYERHQIVNSAVEEADRILMDNADGSVEELDWLTSEVAKRFVEKVNIALSAELTRKDFSDDVPK